MTLLISVSLPMGHVERNVWTNSNCAALGVRTANHFQTSDFGAKLFDVALMPSQPLVAVSDLRARLSGHELVKRSPQLREHGARIVNRRGRPGRGGVVHDNALRYFLAGRLSAVASSGFQSSRF